VQGREIGEDTRWKTRSLPSRTLSRARSARRTSFDPSDTTRPAATPAAASSAARSSRRCRGSSYYRTPSAATPASAATRRCVASPMVCTGARPAAPRSFRSSHHDEQRIPKPHQCLPARLARRPLRGAVLLYKQPAARRTAGAVRQARLLQGPSRGPRNATARRPSPRSLVRTRFIYPSSL
jgi:hypothetical protein